VSFNDTLRGRCFPATHKYTGSFSLTNTSSSCGQGTCCVVGSVDVYVQNRSTPLGGCGKDVTTNQLAHLSGTTGGATPLRPGDLICGCVTTAYTVEVDIPANFNHGDIRVTVLVDMQNDPQHKPGFVFKACDDRNC
jgi:hypothetical protein